MPHSILLGRPWPAPGEPLFLPSDTALALALHEQEQAEAADRCPLCGLPISVCRDPANQYRFDAQPERCHATKALVDKQLAMTDEASARSTVWSARLRE